MIKSLNKMIDGTLEELSAFKITDDHPNIDRQYLADKFVEINGSLMREEYQGSGVVNEQFYQRFECLEVECLQTTCIIAGITVTKKHPIYKVQIPYLQTGIGDKDIRYFGLSSWRKNFRRTDIVGLSFTEYRIFTPLTPAYCMSSHDLFVVNLPTTSTKRLSAMVVLADPRNAPGWSDETSIFPTPSPYKLQMLVFKDVVKSFNIPPDVIDDAQRARSMPAKRIAVENDSDQ